VPYRLRKAFRKIHVRLVRELEKKFSGKVNLHIPKFSVVTGFKHFRASACLSSYSQMM